MKTICVYVNGIMTWPGSSKNWNRRAVTRTHGTTDYRAESLEYLSLPLFSRALGQRRRAQKLLKKLYWYADEYAYERIVLVGHSNGCDVISDALKKLIPTAISIDSVHLIAPACHSDFIKNGFNRWVGTKFHVYIGEKDKALWLANLKPARWLGYGALGKLGPQNVSEGIDVTVTRKSFGHSGWFEGLDWDDTMDTILE